MGTVGTMIINLALNTAGIAGGVNTTVTQFQALKNQINQVAAGSVAGSQAALQLAAAQAAVAKATDAAALAQTRLAEVNASTTATDSVKLGALNRNKVATLQLAEAQAVLAKAETAAAAPAKGGFSGISAAASLASLAILKFGDDATKMAAKYEYDLKLIQTQTGAGADEIEYMKDKVLDLATTVQVGPDQLAQALYHIESVGLRGADALDVLKVAAEGAAVGNADLETVTNALVAVMKSGIAPMSSVEEIMGTLNGTVGTGNIRLQDLAASFSSGVLSTAKQFGLTLQDVGAALATMADQGIPAEEAATRLRITIALLGAPTKIATAQLATIGLTQRSLADSMRGPDGMIGALTMLQAHMQAAGLDAVEQSNLLKTAFGGSRSSAGILTLINSLELFGQKEDAIKAKSGSFLQDFADESKTSEANFRQFGATLEVLQIKLGQGILPYVTFLVQVLALLAQQTAILIPLFKVLTVLIAIKAGQGVFGLFNSSLGVVEALIGRVVKLNRAIGSGELFAGWAKGLKGLQTDVESFGSNLSRGFSKMGADAQAFSATLGNVKKAAASIGSPAATAAIQATTTALGEQAAATTTLNTALTASGATWDANVSRYRNAAGEFVKIPATIETAAAAEDTLAVASGAATVAAEAESVALAGTGVAAEGAATGAAVETVATLGLAGALGAAATAAVGFIIALAPLILPILLVAGAVAVMSAAMGGFDKFAARLMQGVRVLEFEFLRALHVFLTIASALPLVGDGYKKAADAVQGAIDQLVGDMASAEAQIQGEGEKAGIGGIRGLIDAASAEASNSSSPLNQTLIDLWGTSLEGVAGAAASAGTKDMEAYAKGIVDARQAPTDAMKNVLDLMKNQMTDAQEVAQLMGELQSKAMADGLASQDPAVVAATVSWQKITEDRLNQITDYAFMAGGQAGTSWTDALRDGMLKQGRTEADVQGAIARIMADPKQLAFQETQWKALASTWRNDLAPSASVAAGAYQKLADSFSQTDVASMAADIVAKLGGSLAGLKSVGKTAGSDVMLAVAKGIKDKQDAPLNALKDLHNALKNQFSRDREIALLWGEMTSKDLANGLKSQDPYVLAQAIATKKLITDRLDELTGGAYSASLHAGAAVGAGLADSAGVVASGATTALTPAYTGLAAMPAVGAGTGDATGEAVGIRLAEKAGVVAQGTARMISPLFEGFAAMPVVAGAVADGTGETVGIRLASQAGAVAAGTAAMLSPIVNGLGALPQMAYWAGKAADDAVLAGISGGSAVKTLSFAQILANALKNAGSQAKYLQNALDGAAGSMSNLASQAKSDMTSAFSEIKLKAEEFFSTLHDKNLKAIRDAHDLANAQLDAKAALNQAPVTAAQKALDFQRSAQEEFRLRQAVANATDPQARMDAVQALQDFLAQKHIDMMQQEVDAANKQLDAQKKANDDLEKQQEDAENKRYEAQKKSFDQQLAALERYLKSHPKMWKKANAEIQALLKSFGIDYLTAGALLGSDFVKGLWAAVADADKAAKALAKAGSGGGTGTGSGSSTYRSPAPPPKPPPAPATQPVVKPIGTGGGPVAYGLGAWSLGTDTFAQLHAREMVVPPDTAAAIRRIVGGRGFGAIPRLLLAGKAATDAGDDGGRRFDMAGLPTSASARAREVHAALSAGDSPSRSGGGGTIVVKVGEHTIAEITDRNLYVQESIYGGPRVVDLRSSR